MQPDHIRTILETELDTEIWLKQQEKTQIEQEIARGEEMIASLKRESSLSASKPNGSALTALDEEEVPLASTTIVEMSIDGKQVQLACPECKRTAFFSLTGFVNHCRIVHNLVFLSPEERIERCGIPMINGSTNGTESNGSEDPSALTDHDSLLRQKLARIRAECAMNLPEKRPQIKCFDLEPIDLSLDQRSFSPIFPTLEPLPEADEPDLGSQDQITNSSSSQPQAPIIHTEINHQFATAQTEQESRFYIVKRIIVGNLVKASEDGTGYRWKLYIRDEEEFLLKTLRKAIFYLHSSYKPDDVVELTQYPFVLSRTGWGEFPLKIELDFHGVPKPIQLHYQLKLTQGRGSSKWVLGNERKYNIELEKISSALPPPAEHDLAPLKEPGSQLKEPANAVVLSSQPQRERKFLYCKFCGAQHLPLKSFVALQQCCEYRLKVEHINSFTSFNPRSLQAPISPTANRPAASNQEISFWHRQLHHKRSNFRMTQLVVECTTAGINNSADNQQLKMNSSAVEFVAEAGQSFLRELIARAVGEARECQAKAKKNYPSEEPRAVLLTPVHLYNVLVGCEKFDFLTNKNLLSS